jgi:undecaprenyl-diphosphatase
MSALPGAQPAADEPAKLAWLVCVGTIPLIPMGLFCRVDTLRTPKVIVVTLAVVGVAMLVADRLGRGTRRADDMSSGEALALGVAQGMALIPAPPAQARRSRRAWRSASSARPPRASFLLGVPAMFAAAAHEGGTCSGT